jgi:hypothetical protein
MEYSYVPMDFTPTRRHKETADSHEYAAHVSPILKLINEKFLQNNSSENFYGNYTSFRSL